MGLCRRCFMNCLPETKTDSNDRKRFLKPVLSGYNSVYDLSVFVIIQLKTGSNWFKTNFYSYLVIIKTSQLEAVDVRFDHVGLLIIGRKLFTFLQFLICKLKQRSKVTWKELSWRLLLGDFLGLNFKLIKKSLQSNS